MIVKKLNLNRQKNLFNFLSIKKVVRYSVAGVREAIKLEKESNIWKFNKKK